MKNFEEKLNVILNEIFTELGSFPAWHRKEEEGEAHNSKGALR